MSKGGCKIMTVSHDALVTMKTLEKNNMLTWRDDLKYFHNQFEYGVKRRNT
jgi:hypothetical protein